MIHLFRPLVRLELDDGLPVIRCREVAIEAAVQVVKISAEYRRLFPTRTVVIFWTHVLLSSGTLLLLDLPAKGHPVEDFTNANRHALRNVGQILEHFSDMSGNHHFATRCAAIIRGRAGELGLMLPDVELKNLPRQVHSDNPAQPTFLRPSVTCNPAFGSSVDESQSLKAKKFPFHIPENPRSKVAFHSRNQPLVHAVTSAPHIMGTSSLAPPTNFQPFASYPLDSTSPQALYHPPPVPLMDSNPSVFWSPDGSGLPLYNLNTNTSPMSVFNMMEPIPMTDALVRDGFKMSTMWGHDPFGAHGGPLNTEIMQQGPADQQFSYQLQYY